MPNLISVLQSKRSSVTGDSQPKSNNDQSPSSEEKQKQDKDTTKPGIETETGEPDEPDEDEITVTITGPTGENRNYVPYIIAGVGALIILIAGVVLIKTKVIKKGKDKE